MDQKSETIDLDPKDIFPGWRLKTPNLIYTSYRIKHAMILFLTCRLF